MDVPRFKPAGILLLVAAFAFSSCASPVYTLTQMQGDERLQQNLRGKRVEVHYQDDRMAIGYFHEATVDTVVLYRKRNQQMPLRLPAYEIRMIRVLASQEKEIAVFVLILGTTVLLFIVGKAYSEAFSGLR